MFCLMFSDGSSKFIISYLLSYIFFYDFRMLHVSACILFFIAIPVSVCRIPSIVFSVLFAVYMRISYIKCIY